MINKKMICALVGVAAATVVINGFAAPITSLEIKNFSNTPSTMKIKGNLGEYCTTQLSILGLPNGGVTPAANGSTPGVTDLDGSLIAKLSTFDGNNITATMFASNNCSGNPQGTGSIDISGGIINIQKQTGTLQSFKVSGSEIDISTKSN